MFEWGIGDIDARTMAYKVGKTVAHNPPSNWHACRCARKKRRVSPPARLGRMRTFRPSFPTQMTRETGKRPNGAASAILAVRSPRSPRRDYYEGSPRLGAAAAATSYANVRASFSQNRQPKQSFRTFWRAQISARTPVRTVSKSWSHRPSKVPSPYKPTGMFCNVSKQYTGFECRWKWCRRFIPFRYIRILSCKECI